MLAVAAEPLVARGMALLLDAQSPFETLWAESLDRAGRLLRGNGAEVVLWLGDCLDVRAVPAVLRLRRLHPHAGLCIVVALADPSVVQTLLEHNAACFALMLRTRQLDLAEVVAVVGEVVRGKATLEPSVLQQLFKSFSAQSAALDSLTSREIEVLELLALGLRNCEIARRTWRSEKAIEKHVSQVFSKLGLDSTSMPHVDRRVTAARIFIAHRWGPVSPEEAVPA